MPFISEEIYHLLKEQQDDLTVKQYTLIGNFNKDILKAGSLLQADITAIRDARKKNNIKNSEQIAFMMNATGDRIYNGNYGLYPQALGILEKQTNMRVDESQVINNDIDIIEIAKNEIVVISSDRQFYLHVENEIDRTAQKTQLQKELEYQKGFLISVEKKLSNERFVQNAKPEVVETERKKKADAESKIRTIEESLEGLA